MGNEVAARPLPAMPGPLKVGPGTIVIESSWINGHYHYQAFDDDGQPLVDNRTNNPIEHSVRFRDGKAAVSERELRDLKRTHHWGRTISLVGKLHGAATPAAAPKVIRSKGETPVAAPHGKLRGDATKTAPKPSPKAVKGGKKRKTSAEKPAGEKTETAGSKEG